MKTFLITYVFNLSVTKMLFITLCLCFGFIGVPGQNSYAGISKLTEAYLKLAYGVVMGHGPGIRGAKEGLGTGFIVLLPV